MEMNFPHQALRKKAENSADGHDSVLDVVQARQAKSRTVRALRRAKCGSMPDGDDLAARIHYFAAEPDTEIAVRGSFWQKTETAKMDEEPVYQSASANIKDQLLSPAGTGTELNLAGHGAKTKS
ncbi:MAG: hypothetical protein V4657_03460 [Pseudomonadota bacterium]